MEEQGSDRYLTGSQKKQTPYYNHQKGYSNGGTMNKSATNLQKKQNLSKIDQENFPLSRSSRQSRPTIRNYGPFASDQRITPQNSTRMSQQRITNPQLNSQLRNSRKSGHLRVSQYNNAPNYYQNISRMSIPAQDRIRFTQSKFLQPRRYTAAQKPKGNSFYAASDIQKQSITMVDTGNNILWNNPVPRMKGFFSRLVSPHSCKDATWYGISAIVLLGMTIVTCFLCLVFERNLALYVLFLYIISFFLDMLITRNFFLLIITLFHFCFYRSKRNDIERKYRFKYSEMVRIQLDRNLRHDDEEEEYEEQQIIYKNMTEQSDYDCDNSKIKLRVENQQPRLRKSTVRKKKNKQHLEYPDKLQQVNEEENEDGAALVSSYGPCGDQKRRAWITSPDRDDKMKNLKQTQIQARRMTQCLKRNKRASTKKKKINKLPIKNQQNGRKPGTDVRDTFPPDQEATNNKLFFATPGQKNSYSPINKLQSQEQLTDKDGFSHSSPLKMLDLMSSRRKNQSGANLGDERPKKRQSELKESWLSPSRQHTKQKLQQSLKKKPYYLNKGQLIRVFSPGDGAQSFDHPGDDQNYNQGSGNDNQNLNRSLGSLHNENKRYQLNQNQLGKSLLENERNGHRDDLDDFEDNDNDDYDYDDDDKAGLNKKQFAVSQLPKPKQGDLDNILDDAAQDDDINEKKREPFLNKKYNGAVRNEKSQQDDQNEELDKHAKSLDIEYIGNRQIAQDEENQNKQKGRVAYILSLQQKIPLQEGQQKDKFKMRQFKNNDDDLDYEKQDAVILAVSDDKNEVISYDRHSTLPLEEIYGTKNPVSELNDMNLILLDQIYDAFGGGTQQIIKSFKNNNLNLPKEEDDLTQITEQTQTITQMEQESSHGADQKSDPQIRMFNNFQETNFKKQQSLAQDGLQLLEILQKVDFWRQGDQHLFNDESPYQIEQKLRQSSDRPLSTMTAKRGYRIDQPVVQEDQSEQQESERMFNVQEAIGDQHRLSDQDLQLQKPVILQSDTQQDGQRLDFVSISSDPGQNFNEQDSRFGGENRQLPVRLDRIHQSKDSRVVDQLDNKSQLDAVSKLGDDSQLGGSLRMPGDKFLRGYSGVHISRPLKDIRQSRNSGAGIDGMQDSNIGVNPLSVRLDNQELPVGQQANQQESKVQNSRYQLGLMIDDDQIRSRKKIRPPTLLELTQKGRQNMPIQGMLLDEGEIEAVDELQNNDAKIHDERNQYAEEIENQMEELMYLSDAENPPSKLLEANFPCPVPKQSFKHPNLLSKQFSSSKSQNSSNKNVAQSYHPQDLSRKPQQVISPNYQHLNKFQSQKSPNYEQNSYKNFDQKQPAKSAKSLTRSEFSDQNNFPKQQQQYPNQSKKDATKNRFYPEQSQNQQKRDTVEKGYQDQSPKSRQNLARSEFSDQNNFGSSKSPNQSKRNTAVQFYPEESPSQSKGITPEKAYRDQSAQGGKNIARSEFSDQNNFESSKSKSTNQLKNKAVEKGYQDQSPISREHVARSEFSDQNNFGSSKSPNQQKRTIAEKAYQDQSPPKSPQNLARSEFSEKNNFGSSKTPNLSKKDSAMKFYPEESPKSPQNMTGSAYSSSTNQRIIKQLPKFNVKNAEIDQNSRNSSIVENQQVKFDHQTNDDGQSTQYMDQYHGHQRTQYSRKDPLKRQFKPRPCINQMRQNADNESFEIQNAQGERAKLPPRSTGGHFFGSPAHQSQYSENFRGGFTTDFKHKHRGDQEDQNTKRNNFINQSDTDRMISGSPQMLARPGMNRVGSSNSQFKRLTSQPYQIQSNISPYRTTDSQGMAFNKLNQPPRSKMTRTQEEEGFGGPAGAGYFIPRNRSEGLHASEDEYGMEGRRISEGNQSNYRGRIGQSGRISDPMNRQYDPQYDQATVTHVIKSKRVGGGYKYEASTSLQPPSIRLQDNQYRNSSRGPASLSRPRMYEEPNTGMRYLNHDMPPRPDSRENIRNFKKSSKSKKKNRTGIPTPRQSQLTQPKIKNSGPYADVSVMSNFMLSNYKHELKPSLRKEKLYRESIRMNESQSPEGSQHKKKRYQPTFPTKTKDVMKQLIERAPDSLKQVKKMKKKREHGAEIQYLINDEAMRKINLYGDGEMQQNVSRMREEYRNSFITGNESERYEGDDQQNVRASPLGNRHHSTSRINEDPNILRLKYNPTARHLQH